MNTSKRDFVESFSSYKKSVSTRNKGVGGEFHLKSKKISLIFLIFLKNYMQEILLPEEELFPPV